MRINIYAFNKTATAASEATALTIYVHEKKMRILFKNNKKRTKRHILLIIIIDTHYMHTYQNHHH